MKPESSNLAPEWRILILSGKVLALLTLIPWFSSRANFLGYHSLCSYTPVSSIAMFTIALSFQAYIKGQHRKLQRTLIPILLIIIGFSAWWFYTFKLPMHNLEITMTKEYFWIGSTDMYGHEENTSSITFNLTIKNPTSQWTPLFTGTINSRGTPLMINGRKLTEGAFISGGGYSSSGIFWFLMPTVLKPQENVTFQMHCRFFYDRLEAEGASKDEIWLSLKEENFTLSVTGILTAQPFIGDFPDANNMVERSFTWSARPFTTTLEFE